MKMTLHAAKRRDFVAWRRHIVRMTVLCALIVPTPATPASTLWHSTSDIAAVAEQFIRDRGSRAASIDSQATTSVKAGMLDSRLRVSACDKPLQAFLRPGTQIAARTIVGVRCPGSNPWKIYVPVDISVRSNVWITRRPLPRGHLLAREDIVADVRDVSRMTAGYVPDVETLVGSRLRTSILAGRVLTQSLVIPDNVIRRGQSVTLAVASGGISIRMSGKALMDGAVRQRIRVQNLNSGRVVEGIVRSRELVEVLVPDAGNFNQSHPKVTAVPADKGTINNER